MRELLEKYTPNNKADYDRRKAAREAKAKASGKPAPTAPAKKEAPKTVAKPEVKKPEVKKPDAGSVKPKKCLVRGSKECADWDRKHKEKMDKYSASKKSDKKDVDKNPEKKPEKKPGFFKRMGQKLKKGWKMVFGKPRKVEDMDMSTLLYCIENNVPYMTEEELVEHVGPDWELL